MPQVALHLGVQDLPHEGVPSPGGRKAGAKGLHHERFLRHSVNIVTIGHSSILVMVHLAHCHLYQVLHNTSIMLEIFLGLF